SQEEALRPQFSGNQWIFRGALEVGDFGSENPPVAHRHSDGACNWRWPRRLPRYQANPLHERPQLRIVDIDIAQRPGITGVRHDRQRDTEGHAVLSDHDIARITDVVPVQLFL